VFFAGRLPCRFVDALCRRSLCRRSLFAVPLVSASSVRVYSLYVHGAGVGVCATILSAGIQDQGQSRRRRRCHGLRRRLKPYSHRRRIQSAITQVVLLLFGLLLLFLLL